MVLPENYEFLVISRHSDLKTHQDHFLQRFYLLENCPAHAILSMIISTKLLLSESEFPDLSA